MGSQARANRRRRASSKPSRALPFFFLGFWLIGSLLFVREWPQGAPWVGLLDGLAVGAVLGASGLVRSYDESWDEFWETTALAYLLGLFALLYYGFRRETPSAFFWVECAAAMVSYLMLCFVPPLLWLGADVALFFGTFLGWLFSGFFRPEYY